MSKYAWLDSVFKRRFLLIAIFIGVLSPVAIIAIHSYRTTSEELTELALSRKQTIAYLTALVVTERFDRLVDVATSLATGVRFRELVEQEKWAEAADILSDVPQNFSFIDRSLLVDLKGTLQADSPALPGVRGKNFAFRDWYHGVSRDWKPYVSGVYRRTAEPSYNIISVAVPIRAQNNKPAGILVLQIKLEVLLDWIRSVGFETSGFAYVVDNTGKLAAHPNRSPQEEIQDLSRSQTVQEVLKGESGVKVVAREEEDYVVAYEPVLRYGWGVIAEQPARIAFYGRNDQLRKILLAYGLLCLFAAAFSYLLLKTLIQSQQSEEAIRKLNEELKLRAQQLEEANRELDAFSYSVSHDLRAPLRAIDGFSKILLEDYAGQIQPEARRYLEKVSKNTQQMGNLIHGLLALSRFSRQPVNKQEVNIRNLVDAVWEELSQENKNRGELVLGELPPVEGDPILLKQVFFNLLSNACKFTRKQETPRIEVGCLSDGSGTYYVRDNGVGFDMQHAERLFGVFQRLHRSDDFEGTGVGLAIVQQIVRRHGGRIWAEAQPGLGASFYFTL